ncbi:MAG: Hpt domain-containing protein [Lachnospiraceae bacterium]
MSLLAETLAAYGADVDGVMDRFLDDEELLISCLDEFIEENEIPRLKECLDRKDYKGAFEVAHAMKGVTGNLGLTPLYTAVCELVESLRAQEYTHVEKQYEDVKNRREEFVSAYEQMK